MSARSSGQTKGAPNWLERGQKALVVSGPMPDTEVAGLGAGVAEAGMLVEGSGRLLRSVTDRGSSVRFSRR